WGLSGFGLDGRASAFASVDQGPVVITLHVTVNRPIESVWTRARRSRTRAGRLAVCWKLVAERENPARSAGDQPIQRDDVQRRDRELHAQWAKAKERNST